MGVGDGFAGVVCGGYSMLSEALKESYFRKLGFVSNWLTKAQMAELFGKGRRKITEHIQNVFAEGELDEKVVCRNFRHTTQHGAIQGKLRQRRLNTITSM